MSSSASQTSTASVPRHVAIIMDGNNRWAKQRHLPGVAGHKAGVSSVRQTIEGCVEQGVEVLTLFAFSSENWKRPEKEVRGLMDLFMLSLDREVKKLHRHGIRLNIIGDRQRFSARLQQKMAAAEALTVGNEGLILNIAANYGGRWDVVQAARAAMQSCLDGQLQPSDLDEALFDSFTSLANMPEPDLCIRTGGEQRISNFLIWQMAYTELYFCDCYWPDFGKAELSKAIESFANRQRRFGKTSDQIEA
ncbi:di-trans,poly-cis-decaprenylcistransferase [Nitrincola iocasae]|uniref:Ditrans,polycis-undecaprenyl-diphosphate synthase ((2E,6E)-farnesyl-diphosphate specific) n=1 Tax=Nitrincola iocasae TaxID=2614693 RepID=A0A5J6LGX1_9GAMM|nr:polyprenyl diphosphate synthase [Nitrincola iocasae]QEW07708.1 di-trans,poly-cis-decaprenylcistransferase [Nitrincola iocasae]